MQPSIHPVGGSGALVVFGSEISPAVNGAVMALAAQLKRRPLPGMGELIPAFASLLVRFDPLTTEYAAVESALRQRLARPDAAARAEGKLVELPVCYGGEYGPDLDFVAQHAHLTPQQVIELHSGREYPIYMLGFLPGFPYLGGLDERLFTPRLPDPRTRIPAGSVGIGGQQTGVYPMDSPGGWQLLGRTPVRLFTPGRGGQLPYQAGDRIRFVPISAQEFAWLAGQEGGGAA